MTDSDILPPDDPRMLRFCEIYLQSLHRDPVKCIQDVWPDLTLIQARNKAGQFMRKQHKVGKYLNHVVQTNHQAVLPSLQVTEASILAQMARFGFSNVANLYDEDGRLMHPADMSYDHSAAISEVTEKVISSKGEEVVLERKVKMVDKARAIEMLARTQKMFVDKTETSLSIDSDIAALISQANEDDSPIPK